MTLNQGSQRMERAEVLKNVQFARIRDNDPWAMEFLRVLRAFADADGNVELNLEVLNSRTGLSLKPIPMERMEGWLAILVGEGIVTTYVVDGTRYASITGWLDKGAPLYQYIDKRTREEVPWRNPTPEDVDEPSSDVNKETSDAVRDHDQVRSGSKLGGRSPSEGKSSPGLGRGARAHGLQGDHDRVREEHRQSDEPTTHVRHEVAMPPKPKRGRKKSPEMKKLLEVRAKVEEGKELLTKARASVGLQKRVELPNDPRPRLTKGGPVKAAQRGSQAPQTGYEGMSIDALLAIAEKQGWKVLQDAKKEGHISYDKWRSLMAANYKRITS